MNITTQGGTIMKYNKEQRDYLIAKAVLEMNESELSIAERQYIKDKGLINSDGTPPNRIYEIDDEKLFETEDELFDSITEHRILWQNVLFSLDALEKAEEVLIDAMRKNYFNRQKLVEFLLQLDTSAFFYNFGT